MRNQREFQIKGVLLPERKKALDDIGFVWGGEYSHSVSTEEQEQDPTGYDTEEHVEYEFEG